MQLTEHVKELEVLRAENQEMAALVDQLQVGGQGLCVGGGQAGTLHRALMACAGQGSFSGDCDWRH